MSTPRLVIVGAGPAGLMAAEAAAAAGVRVDVYEQMPSAGRKLLMAGRGGLNLGHSEALDAFVDRYGKRRAVIEHLLAGFGPGEQRAWVEALGVATFVGSSGRVFPRAMKAAPLLRAWLLRLAAQGVRLHARHRWLGWDDSGRVLLRSPVGEHAIESDALLLAAGGGSWKRLGSDAGWCPLLHARGVATAPLRPANCGFEAAWSEHFRSRAAGQPLKPVALSVRDDSGRALRVLGECMVTAHGVEGGVVYALSAALRDAIDRQGHVAPLLDLAPGREPARLAADLARPRGKRSLAEHLRRRAGISGVKALLLRECLPAAALQDPAALAAGIKALPLTLHATRPLDEAISSAGGVRFEALDEHLMLRAQPGVFCAGEMLDWEAPTGGYLLTACFASGRVAGAGAAAWLARIRHRSGPPSLVL